MRKFPLKPNNFSKIKIVVSDLHLGTGMFTKHGDRNSFESFSFDNEFSDLVDHWSSEGFGDDYPVELIFNGDILDFLNVPYKSYSFNFISEGIALHKLKSIIKGHPVFFNALKRFISKPNKEITYVIGNHDADFFFPKLQEHFKQIIGGDDFKDKIKFIDKEPKYTIEGNIEIHHGNQFETMHSFNYKKPFMEGKNGKKLLNLPWGSLFIMNVVNKFKREREYIDTIYPHSIFMLYALITDTSFAIRFMSYTVWYFIRTRLLYLRHKLKISILNLPKHIEEELRLLEDGEKAGKDILRANKNLYAVIMGHTHKPKEVRYPNGQVYVNTGTWMKMINLDLRYFGRYVRQPFCLIAYPKETPENPEAKPLLLLLEWKGHSGHYRHFIP